MFDFPTLHTYKILMTVMRLCNAIYSNLLDWLCFNYMLAYPKTFS